MRLLSWGGPMFNRAYRLIAPRVFEPVEIDQPIGDESVVVRPTYLSICNADQRYYQGRRSADVLARKLPMALIHEGIGKVVSDPTGAFATGERVVMVPNDPTQCDDYRAENYLETSRFRGSGFDGFMQEYAVLPPDRLLTLPKEVEDPVAAFTELVSVAMHALSRFDAIAHGERGVLGVWGDGNLGFIVSLLLRQRYPDAKIIVFGRNAYKLADFTFADRTFAASDIARGVKVDHAFECCGGDGAVSAIDQVIEAIRPEGTISLLGVSENPVPINTRLVLEKGLRLFGSSRSGAEDFHAVIRLYQDHPDVLSYLGGLVGSVMAVDSIPAMNAAFKADLQKPMGKTVMEWLA